MLNVGSFNGIPILGIDGKPGSVGTGIAGSGTEMLNVGSLQRLIYLALAFVADTTPAAAIAADGPPVTPAPAVTPV
jgi:hypothetical protein